MRESVIIPSAPVCEISQVNDNGLPKKREKKVKLISFYFEHNCFFLPLKKRHI